VPHAEALFIFAQAGLAISHCTGTIHSSLTEAVTNSRLLEALIIRSLRQHGARIRRDENGNLCLGRFDISETAEALGRNVNVKAD
jgi:hypothetical protein